MNIDPRRVIREIAPSEMFEVPDDVWSDLAALKIELSPQVIEQLKLSMAMFALGASIQSPRNTISYAKAKDAVECWRSATMKASDDLMLGVKPAAPDVTAGEVAARFYNDDAIVKLGRLKGIGFLSLSLRSALDSAEIVLRQLEKEANGPLDLDMWTVWAAQTGRVLFSGGMQLATSSLDRNSQGSAYVWTVERLQQSLPMFCRRFNGYESIRKGLELAARIWSDVDDLTLRMILIGWGSGVLVGYPGRVENMSELERREFVVFAKQQYQALEDQVRKMDSGKSWAETSRVLPVTDGNDCD